MHCACFLYKGKCVTAGTAFVQGQGGGAAVRGRQSAWHEQALHHQWHVVGRRGRAGSCCARTLQPHETCRMLPMLILFSKHRCI